MIANEREWRKQGKQVKLVYPVCHTKWNGASDVIVLKSKASQASLAEQVQPVCQRNGVLIVLKQVKQVKRV